MKIKRIVGHNKNFLTVLYALGEEFHSLQEVEDYCISEFEDCTCNVAIYDFMIKARTLATLVVR